MISPAGSSLLRRAALPLPRALALAGLAALAACSADPSRREQTLARAGRVDAAIAQGAVARDLRAPEDSGRLIYTRATPLQKPAATLVSSPFGIAAPDSARRGAPANAAPGANTAPAANAAAPGAGPAAPKAGAPNAKARAPAGRPAPDTTRR